MFGRNALQLDIAADGTVGMERIAERHQPRIETGMALPASPRINAKDTQSIISRALTARSAGIFSFADGTRHAKTADPVELRASIGQSWVGRK